MTAELKPCPFCGSMPEDYTTYCNSPRFGCVNSDCAFRPNVDATDFDYRLRGGQNNSKELWNKRA